MYFIFWLIFATLFILFIIFRDKAQKEKYQEAQEKYPKIKKEWKKKTIENLEEAIKVYPSKHLLERDKEWEEMINKQREYSRELDNLFVKQLQKEYNLTEEEWKRLESQIFIEDAEKSMILKDSK